MALPAFVEVVDTEFLRPDPDRVETAAGTVSEGLDRQEARLRVMTQQLAVFEATQAIFLGMMEAELPTLEESDIDQALQEMLEAETRLEKLVLPRLREIEQRRRALDEGFDASQKPFLDLLEEEMRMLQTTLRLSKAGRESALSLKDRLLVLEGERMSAPSFWADDDE
jgi:hypothetical protein